MGKWKQAAGTKVRHAFGWALPFVLACTAAPAETGVEGLPDSDVPSIPSSVEPGSPGTPGTGNPAAPGAGGPGGGEAQPGAPAASCGIEGVAERLVADERPWLWAVSGDGQSVVYERRWGRHEFVLHHLPSGRSTVTLARFAAWSPAWDRAYFLDPNFQYPTGQLTEVDVATGATRVLLEAQIEQVQPTPDRTALVLTGAEQNTWLYFPDTRELRHISPSAPPQGRPTYNEAGTAFLLEAPDALLYVDTVARTTVSIPSARRAVGIHAGAAVYFDATGALVAWYPGGAQLLLGQFSAELLQNHWGWPALPGKRRTVLVDATGTARVWNRDARTVELLASNVTAAALSANEERAVFTRRLETGEHQVVLKELGIASTERALLTSPRRLVGTPSPDGRRVAVVESWEEAISQAALRLFDADAGLELALTPPPPTARDSVHVTFRHDGKLLQAFFWDDREVLYDVNTGAAQYTSTRSVVPGEGAFSFWDASERFFFTPRGGYQGNPADLYVWSPGAAQERFLGPRASLLCFLDENTLYQQNFTQDAFFGEGVAELVSWSHTLGTTQRLSPAAERGTCIPRTGVVFREGLVTDETSFDRVGTLVWAAPHGPQRRPVAENVNTYLVEGGSLYFSSLEAICRVPLRTFAAPTASK